MQSLARTGIAKTEWAKTVQSTVLLQRTVRGMPERARFEEAKAAAVVVAAKARALVYRKRYQACIKATRKMQGAYRNATIYRNVNALHKLAGQPDIPVDKDSKLMDPTLMVLRNKYDRQRTLVQSAAAGGNMSMLRLTNPSLKDLADVDHCLCRFRQ